MANKATFTATVNAFISIVVTIVKVKNALLEYTNELWKTTLNDTEASTNVVTKTFANAVYTIAFNKVGNKVFVNGFFSNVSSATLAGNSILFTVTNSEYIPKGVGEYAFNCISVVPNAGSSRVVVFEGSTGEVTITGSLVPNTNYQINGWYQTND